MIDSLLINMQSGMESAMMIITGGLMGTLLHASLTSKYMYNSYSYILLEAVCDKQTMVNLEYQDIKIYIHTPVSTSIVQYPHSIHLTNTNPNLTPPNYT